MLNEGILKKPGPSLKHLCSDTFQPVEVREFPLTTQSWTKGCHILKKLASLHAAHIFICILKKKMIFQSLKCPGPSQPEKHSIFFFSFLHLLLTLLTQISPTEGITVDQIVSAYSRASGHQWTDLWVHNQ